MSKTKPYQFGVKAKFVMLASALVLTSVQAMADITTPVRGALLYEDNFNSFNTSAWNTVTGNGCQYGPNLCGWGNQELEYYQGSNLTIEDVPGEAGNKALVMQARAEAVGGSAFTSGKVDSKDKLAVQYGLIEYRMRVPQVGTGLWPAVWMLGTTAQPWPKKGEIDMMEMGHRADAIASAASFMTPRPTAPVDVNSFVGSNAIFYADAACGSGNPTCAAMTAWQTDNAYIAKTPLTNRFVIYRTYWTDTQLRFTIVDGGVETDLYNGPISIGPEAAALRAPYYLLMNLAVGGNFTDAMTSGQVSAPLPAKMYLDYIRVYELNGQGKVFLGNQTTPETGTFGVFTDNTPTTNKLEAGVSSDIFIWNTASVVAGTITPAEGANVIAWKYQLANQWFGGGIPSREIRDMSNFVNGSLKFRIKIPANVAFKVGVADSFTNENWINFPANQTTYGLVRNGEWAQATIPVSVLRGTSIALQSMIAMFNIASVDGQLPASTFEMAIDDIVWDCGTGAACQSSSASSKASSLVATSVAPSSSTPTTSTTPVSSLAVSSSVPSSVRSSAAASSAPVVTLISAGRPVTGSSALQPAANAVDGNMTSRWESTHGVSPSWITVDLGAAKTLTQVVIDWEAANAASYLIQGSNDNSNWIDLKSVTGGTFGNRTDTNTLSGTYRYVRVYATVPSVGNNWGYSIFELKVYGYTPAASSTPASSKSSTPAPVNVLVQAEDYTSYVDLTTGNTGGAYRPNDNVDIEATTDTNGGYNVGWTTQGEWLEYKVTLAAGSYDLSARVASEFTTGKFSITLDGAAVGSANVGSTGGWQVWQTRAIGIVNVATSGVHILRVAIDGSDFNLNWIYFAVKTVSSSVAPSSIPKSSVTPSSTPKSSIAPSSVPKSSVAPSSTPKSSVAPSSIPKSSSASSTPVATSVLIQAEDYSSYVDLTTGNTGGAYRPNDNVDIEVTTDTNGGYDVGWTAVGEWLEYKVVLAAGTYNINARVASEATAGKYTILVDGVAVGSSSVGNTGGWQKWITQSVGSIAPNTAATHTVRVLVDGGDFNINWIQFEVVNTTGVPISYPGYTGTYTNFALKIDERFDAFNSDLWAKGDGAVGNEGDCRFQPQGVEIKNGVMALTVRKEPVASGLSVDHNAVKRAYDYSCGELRTKAKIKYGRIEARFKNPSTPATGFISSLFTYNADDFQWRELDVETEGGRPNSMQSNYIYGNEANLWNFEWQATRTWGAWEKLHNTPKPYNQFIVYAIEWTPDYVAWFMDGVEVRRLTNDDLDGNPMVPPQIKAANVPEKFTQIMMNFWIPTAVVGPGFGGVPSGNQYPMTAEYDWFRYYEYKPGQVNLDSDNDGVVDSLDRCPNTPAGTKVDSVGCPVVASSSVASSKAPGSSSSSVASLFGIEQPNSSSVTFFVNTTSWATLHYTVNGGAQANVTMTLANGRNTYALSGLKSGDSIGYSFTYWNVAGNFAVDTLAASYKLGGSVISSIAASSTQTTSVKASSSMQSSLVALGNIVPLYNNNTTQEPVIQFDRGDALVTRISDRARDRHAKENHFQTYDHFLPFYWENRTLTIEIVDTVAKGGNSVRMNVVTQSKLDDQQAENRWWYVGNNTLAEFCGNGVMNVIDNTHYWKEDKFNCRENFRPIRIGDKLEFEVSNFLDAGFLPRGRAHYYGTTYLYIVGKGIVPWSVTDMNPFVGGKTYQRDSVEIPVSARMGGDTSVSFQASMEPDNYFMQMATNLSSINGQPFVLGRRVAHTEFTTGHHDESEENGVFNELVGKAGPNFINSSCLQCHVRNGRAPVAAINEPLTKWVFKVGDANGNPDPQIGSVLQPQNVSSAALGEGSVRIGSFTEVNGLRKPNFIFERGAPATYSARITPQLVGIGLLEAISEAAILANVDENDANGDGISGRARKVLDPVSKETRLGRFGYKAAKVSVRHQTAGALNTDMGVMTSMLPAPDCGSAQSGCGNNAGSELSDEHLNNLVKYVSLLGVRSQRDYSSPQVQQGQRVFEATGCAACHTQTFQTSSLAPLAELRNQTIHPYTDMLLHDMGPGLADNLGEGQGDGSASGAEWRTSPLWGVGLSPCVTGGVAGSVNWDGHSYGVTGGEYCTPSANYLHDGRARNIDEAIRWHGGEGLTSAQNYERLSQTDKNLLLQFVNSL